MQTIAPAEEGIEEWRDATKNCDRALTISREINFNSMQII
jgi:hypothetical protein